jgi:hypothetical protein
METISSTAKQRGLICLFLFYAPAPSLGEEVGPLKVLHVDSEGQIQNLNNNY